MISTLCTCYALPTTNSTYYRPTYYPLTSSLYCCSSPLKTVTRKNCCSFSLAKLMQSCSKELTCRSEYHQSSGE